VNRATDTERLYRPSACTARSACQGEAPSRATCDGEDMDTQDAPIEDGHDEATDDQRLDGVIQQVRGDVALGNVDNVREMVRQRLAEAGMPATENDVDAVMSAVDGGTPAG
jgi:hypothetical protein